MKGPALLYELQELAKPRNLRSLLQEEDACQLEAALTLPVSFGTLPVNTIKPNNETMETCRQRVHMFLRRGFALEVIHGQCGLGFVKHFVQFHLPRRNLRADKWVEGESETGSRMRNTRSYVFRFRS